MSEALTNTCHRCSLPRFLRGLAVLLIGCLLQSALAFAQQKKATARPPGKKTAQRRERQDMPRERERWFYEQRAYPLKQIPAGIRQKAIERLEEMRRAERQRAQAPGIEALIQAGQSAWTPIGPQPGNSSFFGAVSGRIGAIAADPTDANTVYLGGAQGGVWKTTDGGQNWTALTDSQPSLAVGAIAIDPSSCTPAPCRKIGRAHV